MNRRLIFVFTLIGLMALASVAQAQATRTWVSGVGDDVNPCSRTAPCKTFAGAISKTASGGEISVLDPGGFGGVTITKSMTIDGSSFVSSILNSGVNGVLINGAGITVKLRRIMINGAGTGLRGIRVTAARSVHLEDVFISGQRGAPGRGVDINLTSTNCDLQMERVTIEDVAGSAVAIQALAAPSTVRALINDSTLKDSGGGLGDGIFAGDNALVTVANTGIFGFTGAAIETFGSAQVNADNCQLVGDVRGALAAANSTIRLSRCTVLNNATAGFSATAPAVVASYGDNYFSNNGANVGILTNIASSKQ
ncbi:MAG: right-handed parallel beta-helix repeat-containing protein [Acidobacteriota bacterium]